LTRSRRPPTPPARLRDRWTISRATTVGLGTGLAALVLASWAERLLYLYALLLVATLACGASILAITFADTRARQRGVRVRPIRAFDVVAGAALTVPALYALWRLSPALGL
jgi:hypothetical protein